MRHAEKNRSHSVSVANIAAYTKQKPHNKSRLNTRRKRLTFIYYAAALTSCDLRQRSHALSPAVGVDDSLSTLQISCPLRLWRRRQKTIKHVRGAEQTVNCVELGKNKEGEGAERRADNGERPTTDVYSQCSPSCQLHAASSPRRQTTAAAGHRTCLLRLLLVGADETKQRRSEGE